MSKMVDTYEESKRFMKVVPPKKTGSKGLFPTTWMWRKGWNESDHPRGQPGNAGQFGSGGGSSAAAGPENNLPGGKGKPPATLDGKPVPKGIKPTDLIAHEPTVQPKTGEVVHVDPTKDTTGNGVSDAARVGVAGMDVPPPPARIPRLPHLTMAERVAEERFANAYEKDPEGTAAKYRELVLAGKAGDGLPNTFNTDDAKVLSPDYNPHGVSDAESLDAKGLYNCSVHGTANAIAKRAFLQHLDSLKEDQKTVLVTSGGVASGKGFALSNVDSTKSIAGKVGAVWDAAGEQNATENPWVLAECEKRGIRPMFVFVHADPKETWENPQRGVVERAGKKGRMVASKLFADSYAYGAKNFKAFMDANRDRADFVVLDNSKPPPSAVPDVPEEALKMDSDEINARAMKVMEERAGKLKPAVLRGGLIGKRVWP